MMGSADQLMDMSLARPYGGQNRLADRLLAIKDVKRGPSEDRQGPRDDRIPQGTPPGRRRGDRGRDESHPRTRGRGAGRACGAARRLRPAGGAGGPRPADLRREAVALDRRPARRKEGRLSPAIQLRAAAAAVPRRGPSMTRRSARSSRRPRVSRCSLFAAPPRVGYPVTLSVAPDGAVYVAVDEQGSLGPHARRRPGRPLHRRRTATARPTA